MNPNHNGTRIGIAAVLTGTMLVLPYLEASAANLGASAALGTGSAGASNIQTSPSPGPAQAGPEFRAAALLDAAGYQAALGAPLRGGPQDNGGVDEPYGGGFTSSAFVVTADDMEVTVTLHSLPSPDLAQSFYVDWVGRHDPEPIAGVGEGAAYAGIGYVGGDAYVKKGAQVLEISSRFGPDANSIIEEIKAETGDASAEADAMSRVVIIAAPALVAAMSGMAATEPLVALPTGGVDACARQEVVAEFFGDPSAIVERVPSDDPPASECRYTMFGDQLYVTVVTEAQLEQAARPDSVGALFDRIADEAAEAPAQGARHVEGDVDADVVLTPTDVVVTVDDCLAAVRPRGSDTIDEVAREMSGLTDVELVEAMEAVLAEFERQEPTCCQGVPETQAMLDQIDRQALSINLPPESAFRARIKLMNGILALCFPEIAPQAR
jgi:hypothetical protein